MIKFKTMVFFFLLSFFLTLFNPSFAAKPVKVPEEKPFPVVEEVRVVTVTPLIQNQKGNLSSCMARESAIKNRMVHLVNLTTNMETVFDSIAARVENYYIDKVKSEGKTVSNYDSLVAAIATQKAEIAMAVANAQTDADSFSCANTPSSQALKFMQDMQSVKEALKKYRTSINNLIVAVRSVTGK